MHKFCYFEYQGEIPALADDAVLCKLHWQLAVVELNRSRLSERDRAREDFLASSFCYEVTIGAFKSARKADNGSWLPTSNGRACGARADAVVSLEERVQFVPVASLTTHTRHPG